MYENLNDFDKALVHFGTRVDIICAMEISNKILPEDAYQQIKNLYKELKKVRKKEKDAQQI